MVTRRSTLARSRCSAILRWREQMAVCAVCWRGLAALILVIDDWAMPEPRGFWEICEDAIKCAQPSLRRNCRFPAGTSRSAIPHWLTASSTGWSTMRIGSRCRVIR